VLAVHGDHVKELPPNAQQLGSSKRTDNEIWHINERVLCIQSHPEFNVHYIKELIVNKMYDTGKLDDVQKNECLEKIRNVTLSLSRNTMNKFLYQFLHI